MNVTLTDKAITKIKELYSQDSALADKALRVYVEAGGCSSYSYGFKFDAPTQTDEKQEVAGVNVIIDPESGKLLQGSVIDYKEDFGSEGFSISNPNAKKSCGCGNSFDT